MAYHEVITVLKYDYSCLGERRAAWSGGGPRRRVIELSSTGLERGIGEAWAGQWAFSRKGGEDRSLAEFLS